MKKSPVAIEYQQTLETIAARIEQSRRETLRTVNRALVELYWFIGQVIAERQERAGWGDAVVEQLSSDLRMRFPDMQGLEVRNLWRMRQFYLAYRDEPNLSPLVTEISWTNHLLILGHTESATEREFYLRVLERLVQSIRLLAADYETQIRSFPGFVHIPDELALTYNDCFLLVDQMANAGLLNEHQLARLKELDGALERMSEKESEEMWTLDALKKNAEWQDIRLMASELLGRVDELGQMRS